MSKKTCLDDNNSTSLSEEPSSIEQFLEQTLLELAEDSTVTKVAETSTDCPTVCTSERDKSGGHQTTISLTTSPTLKTLNQNLSEVLIKPIINNEEMHPCDLCNATFFKMQNLQRHVNMTHARNSIDHSLLKPQEKLVNQRVAVQHGNSIDASQEPKVCERCKKTFKSTADLEVHLKTHPKLQGTYCHQAMKRSLDKAPTTPVKRGLKVYGKPVVVHNISNPEETQDVVSHICKLCDETFPHKSDLEEHFKKHGIKNCTFLNVDKSSLSPQNVTIIPQGFSTTSDDLKLVTRTKIVCCKVCGMDISSDELLEHSNLHTDNVHPCSFCGKKFMELSRLRKHVGIHYRHNGNPGKMDDRLKCQFCPRVLVSQRELESHMELHSATGKFDCKECSKEFLSVAAVRKHQMRRHGLAREECQICGKRFAIPSDVRKHLRTHTGEKPFECDICLKKFSQINYLRAHMKRSH